MQSHKFYYLSTLSFAVTLFLFSSFSWAGSSLQADTSKSGSSKSTLQGSSGKASADYKGKDYLSKDKPAPQKKQTDKNKVVTGYCCENGVVKKAGKSQCEKFKGSYYPSSTQARKNCKPKKITCCVAGKLNTVSAAKCKQLKGTVYTSVAEAKRKCKPVDVFCCVKGKVSKTSPKECKKRRGTLFKSKIEAKKNCFPNDVFCCADGKVSKISPKQCAGKKGTGFQSRTEANRKCSQVSKMFYTKDKEEVLTSMPRSRKRNPNHIDVTNRKGAAGSAAYGVGKPDFSQTKSCTFSGQVLVDGQSPPIDTMLRIWSNNRTGTPHMSRRVYISKRGTFAIHVSPSATSYSMKPSFPPGVNYHETFHNGSLSGVAELMCWENDPKNQENIILRWSSPQAEEDVPNLANNRKVNSADHKPGIAPSTPSVKYGCNFSGKILVDGQPLSAHASLKVKSIQKSGGTFSFFRYYSLGSNGSFSVYVPKSPAVYLLEPSFDLGENYREEFYNGSLAGTVEILCREDEPRDEDNITLRWTSPRFNVPQDPAHRFDGPPGSSL